MNEKKIIESIIKEIVKVNEKEGSKLNEKTVLNSIGISSIDYVKVLIFIEDEFDIEFDDTDLIFEDNATIGDLARKVKKKM